MTRPKRPNSKPPRERGATVREDERLQRLLSRSGVASRRKAEELITAGRVTVNGKRAVLGQRAFPSDDVRVDGKALRPPRENITYLLYKPTGIVTTVKDELGRQTVLTLVPSTPGLHPVGRLDRDSEGLLLLTTDGDLTLLLTHPRYQHEKEYRVWCKQGTVNGETLARLQHGVMLDDGPARAVGARPAPGGAVVVLTEGRKRQLRRMMGAVGYDVDRLVRTRLGTLELGTLQPGQWRALRAEELAALGYTRS
ncbi:MAG TPA: pseudouridine synthase [Trueperaceae bacterium]|nr:pseudouridine synthase [Trueperaceae bacterium]